MNEIKIKLIQDGRDEDEIEESELSIEEDHELIAYRDKINTWRNQIIDLYGEEVLSS